MFKGMVRELRYPQFKKGDGFAVFTRPYIDWDHRFGMVNVPDDNKPHIDVDILV